MQLTGEKISVFELLAAAREIQGTNYVKGDGILCYKRFEKETTHMAEFRINEEGTKLGKKGEYHQLFLTETGFQDLLDLAKANQIHMEKHAVTVEGCLTYTSPFPPGDTPGR